MRVVFALTVVGICVKSSLVLSYGVIASGFFFGALGTCVDCIKTRILNASFYHTLYCTICLRCFITLP
jgi:hypothetical protein